MCFVGLPTFSYAQQEFEIELQSTPVTCSGDGSITAQLINDGDPVESVNYLLFRLPNENTVFLENNSGEFSGLREGEYLVKGLFTLEGEDIQVEEGIVVANEFSPLVFSLQSSNLCGEEDGVIEVSVQEGAGALYELEGVENRPPQTSPRFENLPEGAYTIWVSDECGNRLSQSVQLYRPGLEVFPTGRQFERMLPDCQTISVGHRFRTIGAETEFPITATFSVNTPGGATDVRSLEIEEEDIRNGFFFADIPFFHDQLYTYSLEVTDPCGNSDSHENLEVNRKLSISSNNRWGAGFCGNRRIAISPENFVPPFQIEFLEHPEEFDPGLFNANFPGPYEEETIFFGNEENPIPEGSYRVRVEDACGNEQEIEINHTIVISGPVFEELKSCDANYSTLEMISHDFLLEDVVMTSAPEAYGLSEPLDLTPFVNPQNRRRLYLTDLPPGTYEFELNSSCGTQHTPSFTIEGGEVFENTIEVEENCGTFNLFLNYVDNLAANQNVQFGIQRFNPATGNWGHPSTNNPYVEGQEITRNNAHILDNQANNFNLPFTGRLRVIKSARVWRSGDGIQPGQSSHTFCIEPLKTFEFRGRTILNSVNFFRCEDGSYDVAFSAEGYDPLNFQIREKNGEDFILDNGENQLFSRLEAGKYRFRVSDRCGNVQNFDLQIAGENLPRILPENLCPDENGRLYIPNLEFLSFEWYKENEPNTILSETSSLEFESFDPANDFGIYKVKLSHPDPDVCLNKELSFEISEENLNPSAGQGLTAAVCEGESVDLFDFLDGTYGEHGTWEEVNETGKLIGNIWSTSQLAAETYRFRYTVNGLCTGEESTEVVLQLNQVPPAPEANPQQEFCGADSPTLAQIDVLGDDISWYEDIDSGEILPMDTPLEDGKSYYAAQTIDGCISTERSPVQVVVYPEFELNEIEGDQEVYQMQEPSLITGSDPVGGKGQLLISWEFSSDGQSWEQIDGADELEFQPEPLMASTYFRRVVEDEKCGLDLSNQVFVEVLVAPILTSEDFYGPLRGYEENQLSLLDNDTFKDQPIVYEDGDVEASILEITNVDGESISYSWEFDENGELVIPAGVPPGRYQVNYQVCQVLVPDNCSENMAEIWVGVLDLDVEKTVDRTQAVEGEIITYTINITNQSEFEVDEINIEDLFPENVMVIQATPDFTEGQTWITDELAIGQSMEFEVDVITLSEGTIVNQVHVTIGDYDTITLSPETQVRAKSVDMAIDKSSSSQEIVDGDEFEYLLKVTNLGLDDATAVTITDVLHHDLDLVRSTISNNPDGLIVEFDQEGQQLSWRVEEFPVGSELTITLSVTAMREGKVENIAIVESDETDSDLSNNRDAVSIDISPLFIPNVFKPDNDGKNETFIIRASHKFSKISLLIFNRWGDPIYESEDYKNDWNAEEVTGGTYYYLIKGVDARNQERRYKGWVQVLK